VNIGCLHDPNLQPAWSCRRYLLWFALLIALSFSCRLLAAQDARIQGTLVHSAVVAGYKRDAALYGEHLSAFFSRDSSLSNPDLLGHPPGYSLLWMIIFKLGGGDRAMQLLQIVCDSIAACVLFLIVAELLPRSIATIAAVFAALAPQFAWNSVILLPDTLAILPVLLAVYCLIIAAKHRRLALAVATGCLIGISCWLRSNALFLAPFACLFVPFLLPRGSRLRFVGAMLLGSLLIVGPLTIRNALVFRHFVPVSLGAGQTMLEGIGDYDPQRRFGIPNTDIEIMSEEARTSGNPEYAQTLFGPDGVSRERSRLTRAFNVIRSHPFWFLGVMVRRAVSMLRLERVPVISSNPAVFQPLTELEMRSAFKTIPPAELTSVAPGIRTQSLGMDRIELSGDDSKYGVLVESAFVRVRAQTEYAFTVPIRMNQGRFLLEVTDTSGDAVYGDRFADPLAGLPVEEQPAKTQYLPFVAISEDDVKIRIRNGAARGIGEIGTIALFELGPASHTWMRFPRAILGAVQRLFLTAVMLPLTIIGLGVLVYDRCWRVLAVLILVPAYYFVVQSALHTEYRYVLALHDFLFVLAATAVWFVWTDVRRLLRPHSR
jgi:hypothetical protein